MGNREFTLGIPEFIVAILGVEPNGINGRTVIQKLGYFASEEMRKDVGYGPDFHGPFSPSIAGNLENLVGLDFVIEKGRWTSRGRTMYSYFLTDDGKRLAEEIKKDHPEEYSVIRDVVKKCGKTAHFNYNILSWAAKLHFILKRSRRKMTYEEAIKVGPQQAHLYGWELSGEEIDSALELLLALGLLKKR